MTSGIDICFNCPKFKHCINPRNAQKHSCLISCRKEKEIEKRKINE